MRPLSTQELLVAWERGLRQRPAEWALALLAAADPGAAPDAVEGLSAGQRDSALLTLREWTFGPRLVSVAACPACSERLEMDLELADLYMAPPAPDGEALSVTAAGYEVHFRLPNSLDLAAVSGERDAGTARRRLLERCVLEVHAPGEGPASGPEQDRLPAGLPDAVAGAVAARMAQADPQADVQLALSCPACGHEWLATFDIVSFFWQELDTWARRTLYDVHRLALAYAWAEADILNMDPWRRQVYLDMLGG